VAVGRGVLLPVAPFAVDEAEQDPAGTRALACSADRALSSPRDPERRLLPVLTLAVQGSEGNP
jgi:hypothetical protein